MPSDMISYCGFRGRRIVFQNQGNHYPVNAYQSFILATAASTEAIGLSATQQRPLHRLRGVEVCCGGGAAALALRATGLGVVDASDINPHAVAACEHNAALNGLDLDACEVRDCLGPSAYRLPSYDIIACNPPCRPEWAAAAPQQPESDRDWLEIAVDGGDTGEDFALSVLDVALGALAPDGRLVLIVTSTQDFVTIFNRLDTLGLSWWIAAASPVSQPYVPTDTPIDERIRQLHEERRIIAWDGGDGWFWRLSWAVVVSTAGGVLPQTDAEPARPWFQNYGYEVQAARFRRAAEYFERLFGPGEQGR